MTNTHDPERNRALATLNRFSHEHRLVTRQMGSVETLQIKLKGGDPNTRQRCWVHPETVNVLTLADVPGGGKLVYFHSKSSMVHSYGIYDPADDEHGNIIVILSLKDLVLSQDIEVLKQAASIIETEELFANLEEISRLASLPGHFARPL